MQSDRAALCAHWFASSDNDFVIARDYRVRIPSAACFHAQQGAEKALKALLVMLCGDAPRTHVASVLVGELEKSTIVPDEIGLAAKSLDKYYAPTRYPDALGGGNPDSAFVARDADLALEAADAVAAFCRRASSEIRD